MTINDMLDTVNGLPRRGTPEEAHKAAVTVTDAGCRLHASNTEILTVLDILGLLDDGERRPVHLRDIEPAPIRQRFGKGTRR